MEQLTVGDILNFVKELQKNGMSLKEIKALPVYLGGDDELNNIHTGWYTNIVDNGEDDKFFREMINENRNNIALADDAKAILIS